MLFNTAEFFIFFILVFFLYWFACRKSIKVQNWLLLIASYYFYSCWDWRFMFLLAISTILCYFSGARIHSSNTEKKRKIWLWIGIGANLGFLGFFKYYNFFIQSFADLLQSIGFNPHISTLNIILPVGISFYTFHGLSYVFDIYNRKIEPTKSWVNYSLFVSFFPLLVAGPIERATHLLPQLENARTFNYSKAVNGMRQILWGLFKKVVIADTCAIYANDIFDNYQIHSASTLVLGAMFFAIQIYGDFSGYSDIALGTARLMGFELLKNFNYPYFSRDIAEFWRRWHISLSSWFKDYLYIPLGGSRGGNWMRIRNTFIIFIVSGFWHGANWTFVSWGALNALFMVPSMLMRTNRQNMEIVAKGKLIPSVKEALQVIVTFALASFAWIFFRAESMTHAFGYVKGIFSASLLSVPGVYSISTIFLVIMYLVIEWCGKEQNFALEDMKRFPKIRAIRWIFYLIILILIFMHTGAEQAFIYFQF